MTSNIDVIISLKEFIKYTRHMYTIKYNFGTLEESSSFSSFFTSVASMEEDFPSSPALPEAELFSADAPNPALPACESQDSLPSSLIPYVQNQLKKKMLIKIFFTL